MSAELAASDSAERLSARPPISAPRKSPAPVQAAQPALGLLGLTLVIPIAAALAVGAGGGDGSVLVLGPIVTYSLPLVAMVAFWWEDWPGTRLRASWSGWADTALIILGAVVLTGIGQAVAGGPDLAALFDDSPGPGHVPTFPATLPLAGTAFVAMLQITLVGEGWPLRRLPRIPAGLLAVTISWAIALVVYLALVRVDAPPGSDVIARHGPVPGADLGAVLVVIGAVQVLFYVVWRGWPFSRIGNRAVRLSSAHLIVLGVGILAYLVVRAVLDVDVARIAAVAGCFIAAGLLLGMLFEDWLTGRVALLILTLALTALLALVLGAIADAMDLSRVSADDWVEHAALNAISISVILHVAIGRRWPFRAAASRTVGG